MDYRPSIFCSRKISLDDRPTITNVTAQSSWSRRGAEGVLMVRRQDVKILSLHAPAIPWPSIEIFRSVFRMHEPRSKERKTSRRRSRSSNEAESLLVRRLLQVGESSTLMVLTPIKSSTSTKVLVLSSTSFAAEDVDDDGGSIEREVFEVSSKLRCHCFCPRDQDPKRFRRCLLSQRKLRFSSTILLPLTLKRCRLWSVKLAKD